jgi:hypothetical protein
MSNPYDNARLAMCTGYWPESGKSCIYCFSERVHHGRLYCENCGDMALLMPAVATIRKEWQSSGILTRMTRREDDLLLAEDERLTAEINRPV